MENKITRTQINTVAKTEGEKNLALQAKLLDQLESGTQEMGQEFTSYGKQCVINAISSFLLQCKSQNIPFEQVDGTTLRLALQNVGYTELNMAAIPSECYYNIRKTTMDVDGQRKSMYTVAIMPQGAGNEKLTRKYGVGIKTLHPAILIREGDEFIMPSFNGLEITPPVYKPQFKNMNNKVAGIMYIVEKTDGRVEYLISTRESIKPNIIAQIRQNALYSEEFRVPGKTYEVDKKKRDAFYDKINNDFENLTVDEILSSPEWMKWVNPTYTSGGSKEAMIIRKMKNNALKNYPKEYDNTYIAEAVKDMFEDKDDSLNEEPKVVQTKTVDEKIEEVEKDIGEEKTSEEVADFVVDEQTGEAFPTKDSPEEATFESIDEEENIPQSSSEPETESDPF